LTGFSGRPYSPAPNLFPTGRQTGSGLGECGCACFEAFSIPIGAVIAIVDRDLPGPKWLLR
jgi:hypothetical protein